MPCPTLAGMMAGSRHMQPGAIVRTPTAANEPGTPPLALPARGILNGHATMSGSSLWRALRSATSMTR